MLFLVGLLLLGLPLFVLVCFFYFGNQNFPEYVDLDGVWREDE